MLYHVAIDELVDGEPLWIDPTVAHVQADKKKKRKEKESSLNVATYNTSTVSVSRVDATVTNWVEAVATQIGSLVHRDLFSP